MISSSFLLNICWLTGSWFFQWNWPSLFHKIDIVAFRISFLNPKSSSSSSVDNVVQDTNVAAATQWEWKRAHNTSLNTFNQTATLRRYMCSYRTINVYIRNSHTNLFSWKSFISGASEMNNLCQMKYIQNKSRPNKEIENSPLPVLYKDKS